MMRTTSETDTPVSSAVHAELPIAHRDAQTAIPARRVRALACGARTKLDLEFLGDSTVKWMTTAGHKQTAETLAYSRDGIIKITQTGMMCAVHVTDGKLVAVPAAIGLRVTVPQIAYTK